MLAATAMSAAAWAPFSGIDDAAPQAASSSFGQLLDSLFAADPVSVARATPQPARSRTADDQASTPAASSAPDVLALLMSMGALRTPPLTQMQAALAKPATLPIQPDAQAQPPHSSMPRAAPTKAATPAQISASASTSTSTSVALSQPLPSPPLPAATARQATPAAAITPQPQPDNNTQTAAAEPQPLPRPPLPAATTPDVVANPQPLPHQPRTALASTAASQPHNRAPGRHAQQPAAPLPWRAATATPAPVKPELEQAAQPVQKLTRSETLSAPTLPVPTPHASCLQATAASSQHASAPAPGAHAVLHGHQTMTPALSHTGWNDAIAQRVLWMAQDSMQSASITLNPPNLGALQVSLQIENQQASVQFVTTNAQVQQALQDALPVLRDLLAQSGIALGQADVGANPNPAKWTALAARRNKAEEDRFNAEPLPQSSVSTRRSSSAGYRLVNVFA